MAEKIVAGVVIGLLVLTLRSIGVWIIKKFRGREEPKETDKQRELREGSEALTEVWRGLGKRKKKGF